MKYSRIDLNEIILSTTKIVDQIKKIKLKLI